MRWMALALAVLAGLLVVQLAVRLRSLGAAKTAAVRENPAAPVPFQWPAIAPGLWKVFRAATPPPAVPAAGSLASRYRLAGVFLILTDPGESNPENRCAILDDVQTQQQYLAAEGEQVDRVRVVSVASDHVVLSDGAREETLYLAAGTLDGAAPGAAAGPAPAAPPILEANRFGNRVGETRWEFNRDAILEYYQEMMDNPERLASLFLAMEADRDGAGKVAGYRLNMDVGERDFYTQVGLQHGDVVRKVNSMRMTSQRRAEYFIGEFVQGRLGAVVLDIERNGQPTKLVYLIK